jgi:hypothetical protein
MASGRYEPRMVRINPDYYVMEWVTQEGIPLRDSVEMTEQELRAALKMKWSRTDKEIDQLISEARDRFAA